MSENLYDALEVCIHALQRGEDVESCLASYPQLVEELRPLLAAGADASSLAVEGIPTEVARREKAKFLNAAAEFRERDARAASHAGGSSVVGRFRRSFLLTFATITAALVAFVFLGGTGLVYASSGSLPGDALYRVKLSWEGLRLQLAAPATREALSDRFERERVHEVDALLERGRAEDVEFSGVVTAMLPDQQLVVSGITVFLREQTEIKGSLAEGVVVRVEGLTQNDGTVIATQIKVLTSPDQGDDEDGNDHSGPGGGSEEDSGKSTQTRDDSGEDSGHDEDDDEEEGSTPPAPDDDSGHGGSTPQAERFDLEGRITQRNDNSIVVGGVLITLNDDTEIRGRLSQGATVRARGTVSPTGDHVATRVEVISSGGGDNDGSATNTPSSPGGGDGSGGGSGGDDGGGGGDDDGEDHSGSSNATPTP